MSRLKRVSSGVLVAAMLMATAACNEKQAVIDGIIALQSAAILANQTNGSNGKPLLSDQDAVKVVTYTTQSLAVIQAGANGWQAQIKTGWAAFLADIPANTKTQLATPIAVISGAIGAL